ncbi:hypothetical protein Tco_1485800 [Tanacetum coccineum]
MKTPSVATYKIIKQGEKGVYQIVRADGTDIVYINFGAVLKSISRDDLTELYRIVMNRYGLDGPEDKLEKGFWKCLRIMFEEPLSTDSIWSEIEQQKIWNIYFLLESMDTPEQRIVVKSYQSPFIADLCLKSYGYQLVNHGLTNLTLTSHSKRSMVRSQQIPFMAGSLPKTIFLLQSRLECYED